jgi:hypothetical protein
MASCGLNSRSNEGFYWWSPGLSTRLVSFLLSRSVIISANNEHRVLAMPKSVLRNIMSVDLCYGYVNLITSAMSLSDVSKKRSWKTAFYSIRQATSSAFSNSVV